MVGIGSRHGREETLDTKCGCENVEEVGCVENISAYGIILTCIS
jgi:hypothetical protein